MNKIKNKKRYQFKSPVKDKRIKQHWQHPVSCVAIQDEAIFPNTKWKQSDFFFDNLLCIQRTYFQVNYLLAQPPLKFLLLIWYEVHMLFLMSSTSSNLTLQINVLSIGNKNQLHWASSAGYGGCYTWTILSFTKNCCSKSKKNKHEFV